MATIEESAECLRLTMTGLPEAVRLAVVKAYRARGGSFDSPSASRLRAALREVRRGLEVRGGNPDGADALTRREDAIEMIVQFSAADRRAKARDSLNGSGS